MSENSEPESQNIQTCRSWMLLITICIILFIAVVCIVIIMLLVYGWQLIYLI